MHFIRFQITVNEGRCFRSSVPVLWWTAFILGSQPGCCLSCIWGLPSVEVLAMGIFFYGINQYQLHSFAAWYPQWFSSVLWPMQGVEYFIGFGGSSWSSLPPVRGPFALQAFGGLGQVVVSYSIVMDNLCTQLSLLVGFTILSAHISPHLSIVDEFNQNCKA